MQLCILILVNIIFILDIPWICARFTNIIPEAPQCHHIIKILLRSNGKGSCLPTTNVSDHQQPAVGKGPTVIIFDAKATGLCPFLFRRLLTKRPSGSSKDVLVPTTRGSKGVIGGNIGEKVYNRMEWKLNREKWFGKVKEWWKF